MARAVVIRPARPGERLALEQLQRRSALAYAETRAALLADRTLIELPGWHVAHSLVADADGQVLGFATVLPRDDGDAELDGLFVEPGRWRRGVGRALVAAGEALARQRGAATLHVVANLNALAFYRACGFLDGALVEMRLGEALEMHRPLRRLAA